MPRNHKGGKAEQFDLVIVTQWSAGVIAIVLALVAFAVVYFAVMFDSSDRDLHRYQSAPVCPSGASAYTTGCKSEIQASVESRGETSGKDPLYYITIFGPPPANGQIDLPGNDALWAHAASGDNVTVTLWNGNMVEIADNGYSFETGDAPRMQTAVDESILLAAAVWFVSIAMFLVRSLTADRGGSRDWTGAMKVPNFVAVFAMIAFVCGFVAGGASGSFLVTWSVGLGLSVLGAVYVLVDERSAQSPANRPMTPAEAKMAAKARQKSNATARANAKRRRR